MEKLKMRIIKRYDNRKLYDTETSKTVTLKDVALLIREGQEIKVVDGSDKDITNKVLAQIFLQENLETKQFVLSKFLLEWLIKESGKLESLTKRVLLGGVGLASLTQDKAEQLASELVKRGEVEEGDKAKFVKQIIDKVEKGSKDFKHLVEGLVQEVTAKEKVETKTEEEIIAQKEKEIADLKKQIAELSKDLAKEDAKEDKNSKKSLKAS
jgi:polyhydroxyalkanoate synthesis repressor PhaR